MKTLTDDRGPNPRTLTDSDGKRYEVIVNPQPKHCWEAVSNGEDVKLIREIKNEMPGILPGDSIWDGNRTSFRQGVHIVIENNPISRTALASDTYGKKFIFYYNDIVEIRRDGELIWQRN